MSAKGVVLTVVGAACVAAAGAGGYLAVRLNPAAPSPTGQASAAAATVEQTAAQVPAPAGDRTLAARTMRESAATAPRREAGSEPAPKTPAPVAATATRKANPVTASPASPADAPAAVEPPPPVLPPVETTPPTPLPTLDVPPPTAEPPASEPEFDEVTVKSDSVIGIRLDNPISSETAQVEDRVTAHVSRDLTVDGRTAIPAGSELDGTVTFVSRGGRLKDRARLGIRFTTLVLADHSRVPIDTETIFREGESPTGEATSKIGASAVVGAILGAVIAGRRGAIIGSTAGAAGGTAAVMAGGPHDAVLPAGTPLTVRLTSPVTLLVARQTPQL
jgi:hypothetical protein